MNYYEALVTKAQMNYSVFGRGISPYKMSRREKPSYKTQLEIFSNKINSAECVIVGGASGLSAAGV